MKKLSAMTLFCCALILNFSNAQDPKSAPTDATPRKLHRTHYAARNSDAVVLAEVVGAHFKGDATLIATPAGSGNSVLVSGSPEVVTEVVKLLEQLDKKPRSIEVEISIAEVTAPKDGKELSPADIAKAKSLAKEGAGQRIMLTAIEGQQANTKIGENKPFVSSSGVAGGGFGGKGVVQKSVNYQPVGLTVKMTPRIVSENVVSLELSVQESKIKPVEEGGPPSFVNNSLTTKLNVPAGESVVVQTVRADGMSGATVAVVVVTARVVDGTPANSKP